MATIVVKLGGCNGSGKSSVMREVIKQLDGRPFGEPRVEGYSGHAANLNLWSFVLGRYDNDCGGMDAMGQKNDIRKLFHRFVPAKGGAIVFMEGLIVGKTYGYLGEQLKQLGDKGKVRTLWAFMGTPFDECAERVQARRAIAAARRGKEPAPFDPERTMRQTFTIMERLEEGVRNGKYPIVGEVMRLEYKPGRQPATHAKQLIKKALEMYHAAS